VDSSTKGALGKSDNSHAGGVKQGHITLRKRHFRVSATPEQRATSVGSYSHLTKSPHHMGSSPHKGVDR
jgi:hypothetical protein